MRESEVIYLLLKKFSSIGDFKLKHVSIRGMDESNCFIQGVHKSKDEWKKEILLLFPKQFQQIIQSNFQSLDNCEIFNNKENEKDKHYNHYDVVLKKTIPHGDQRYYYIEAKGDGNDNTYTYIKGQIEKALGQLILAGRNIDHGELENKLKVGDNFCIAFPIEWKDKLYQNLLENKIYNEFKGIFGRKEGKEKFKSLFEFRFFLVDREDIIIINRTLKKSSILWQSKQTKSVIYN